MVAFRGCFPSGCANSRITIVRGIITGLAKREARGSAAHTWKVPLGESQGYSIGLFYFILYYIYVLCITCSVNGGMNEWTIDGTRVIGVFC